ncbi:MAG TPA: hypothetical protein VFT29_20435, partial [Gemmatimonadaceae bacterium]|nr:hypothetical protein [Gemmatimonadaceae bacterium]
MHERTFRVLALTTAILLSLPAVDASAQADTARRAGGVAFTPRPHDAAPSLRAARRTTPVHV